MCETNWDKIREEIKRAAEGKDPEKLFIATRKIEQTDGTKYEIVIQEI